MAENNDFTPIAGTLKASKHGKKDHQWDKYYLEEQAERVEVYAQTIKKGSDCLNRLRKGIKKRN